MNRILKFEADWCQPCKILSANMKDLTFPVEIIDIDAEGSADAVAQYGIRGVPTLIFIKDNKEVERVVGVISRDKIEQLIKENYGMEISN